MLENIDKTFFDIPYVDVSQLSRLPKKDADIGMKQLRKRQDEGASFSKDKIE